MSNVSDSKDSRCRPGELSEHELLRLFEAKTQLIRDRVASVVHHYHTGAYLVGRPGTSKTYTVREALESLGKPWVYRNARMTPMGLFCFIAEHPEHTIVLDDIASLFKNDQAMQILMAALDGKPSEARTISYKSKDVEQTVLFTGSVIAISNVPLRTDPLARALGSRIVTLEHEPSDDEIASFMRHLARMGFEELSAKECVEVAEFIIAETRDHDLRLDLRHLTKGWQDYRQHKHRHSKSTWKDLVRTSLQKLAMEPLLSFSKKDDIELQRQKVQVALGRFPNDRKSQIEHSGLKPSTFYVRLREVLADADSSAA